MIFALSSRPLRSCWFALLMVCGACGRTDLFTAHQTNNGCLVGYPTCVMTDGAGGGSGGDSGHGGSIVDGGTGGKVCPTGTREICGNKIDDDCNGLTDCADPACFGDPSCSKPGQEICNNGIDDNGDGLIDCADPECANSIFCRDRKSTRLNSSH